MKRTKIKMNEVTEAELKEMISKNKNINFLAAAITPWHALGIDATVKILREQGVILSGYIILVSHTVTGSGLSQEHFNTVQDDKIQFITIKQERIKRTITDKLKNKFEIYQYYLKPEISQANLDVFYWVVPLKPSYEMIPKIMNGRKNIKLSIYIIDEGIGGTYLTSTLRWIQIAFKEGTLRDGIRALWTLSIRDKFFLFKLMKREAVVYFQLLIWDGRKWVPNQKAIDAYRQVIGRVKTSEKYAIYSNAVIISSDMLKQTGHINNNVDLMIYQSICQILEEKKITCILKPHPRETEIERYSDLNCKVESEKNIAQETILGSIEEMPRCMIGFASTTLITANLLFGIEAISLNKIIKKDLNSDRKVFRKFQETFSTIISFPETVEELLAMLSE